jgi:hypothetical protein
VAILGCGNTWIFTPQLDRMAKTFVIEGLGKEVLFDDISQFNRECKVMEIYAEQSVQSRERESLSCIHFLPLSVPYSLITPFFFI